MLQHEYRMHQADQHLERLRIADIYPNPNQPRRNFDAKGIEELAQSILQYGLIQPIVVRRINGRYELIAGERRLRACKSLGMEQIAALVQRTYEEDSAFMALIENLQREDLHYLEEAESFQAMIHAYSLTQEELAARLACSQSTIANKLRILKLSPDVKREMVESKLSERHARALLRLPDEAAQLSVIQKVRQKGLSVKETEQLVEKTVSRLCDEQTDDAKPRPKIIRLVKDYRLFLNSIKAAVGQLKEAGLEPDMRQEEDEQGVMIHIYIPKN